MSENKPVDIDGKTGKVLTPTPRKTRDRYRCRLQTMSDVQREMAKVYRESRTGILDVQDASKLTWMLQALSKVIEGGDLEKRIEALEQKQDED